MPVVLTKVGGIPALWTDDHDALLVADNDDRAMAEAIGRVAAPWFRVADKFSESVEHCESHGIRDKGTVKAHDFLVLQ